MAGCGHASATESLQSDDNADETLAELGVVVLPGWKAEVAPPTAFRQVAIVASVLKACKKAVHDEARVVGIKGFAVAVALAALD